MSTPPPTIAISGSSDAATSMSVLPAQSRSTRASRPFRHARSQESPSAMARSLAAKSRRPRKGNGYFGPNRQRLARVRRSAGRLWRTRQAVLDVAVVPDQERGLLLELDVVLVDEQRDQ